MANLREIRAAMPADFVEEFRNRAETHGMTHRQLAAVCIALGYKVFKNTPLPPSLPSEPSPVVADK